MDGRNAHLPGPAVRRTALPTPPVVSDRSLRDPKQPRHRALRLSDLQQYRHRRPRLVLETTHRQPPTDNPPETDRPRRRFVNLVSP